MADHYGTPSVIDKKYTKPEVPESQVFSPAEFRLKFDKAKVRRP